MRKLILMTIMLFSFSIIVKAQVKSTDLKDKIDDLKKSNEANETKIDSLNYLIKESERQELEKLTKIQDSVGAEILKISGPRTDLRNSRISFVIGMGTALSPGKYYQMPIVSPIDNNVKLERSQNFVLNASLGIVYTPYYYIVKDPIYPEGIAVPKCWSFAAFFNPATFVKGSNLQENFSLSNLGLGVGWKFYSGISVFLTGEIYSLKQPRKWFIDEFIDGTKQYTIAGNIQSSFDANDNNVFRTKLVPSIGIKLCYTFDIIKSVPTQ